MSSEELESMWIQYCIQQPFALKEFMQCAVLPQSSWSSFTLVFIVWQYFTALSDLHYIP